MSIIALFFPSCISMMIRHKRNISTNWNPIQCIIEYGVLTVIDIFLTEAIIVYILKISPDSTAFESFPFFIKYVAIASMIASVVPYIGEIISKYIKVSFSIIENDKK